MNHFGLASILPGIQTAIDILTELAEDIRSLLHRMSERSTRPIRSKAVKRALKTLALKQHEQEPPKRKRGRPKQSTGIKNYWQSLTPEQRSAEMRRRLAVHRGEAKPRAEKHA